MEKNRAFQEMKSAALERLKGKDYPSVFQIRSFQEDYRITWPECEIVPRMEGWHYLILLHYLDMADGTPLSGEYMTFGNLKDGLVRGTKFDQTMDIELGKYLKGKTKEQMESALSSLGAEFVESKADLSAKISVFPRYPMMLHIYFADEEFPASAKLLVNKSADHYLTIEDAVTVGEVVLQKLKGATR